MEITSQPETNSPIIIFLKNPSSYFLLNETTGRHYFSYASQNWKLKPLTSRLVMQSQLTGKIVTEILTKNSCALTSFTESSSIHLNFLEPILKHLNRLRTVKYKNYPFT